MKKYIPILAAILLFVSYQAWAVRGEFGKDGTGTDDQTASEVTVTPAGNISSTDVQNALEELDSEKESHTSNDIDPDRMAGDSDDDNLLDQDAMEMVESGVTDITDDTEWHPTGYKYCVWRLTGDTDPCALILSETDTTGSAFSEGDKMLLVNAGTSVFEIGDIDGQQEVLPSGGTVYVPQNGWVEIVYSGSAWHIGPPATDRKTFDTINARVKTFSFSGRTGTYQLSSISTNASDTTATLTEAEACGYILLDDAGVTTYILTLPDADPGSGYVGELGQALACHGGNDIYLRSGTTVLADGTATDGSTGANINAFTTGEYMTWEPYYDTGSSDWRWAIRIKDD